MEINLSYYRIFLDLSVKATGYSRYNLLGTGMAEVYLQTQTKILGPDNFYRLLDTFQEIEGSGSEQHEADSKRTFIRDILNEEHLGPMARNLIKLWYTGYWYEMPDDWQEAYGKGQVVPTFVVQAESYVQGLVWDAIGAHPAGAKAPGFASWSEPPKEVPKQQDNTHRTFSHPLKTRKHEQKNRIHRGYRDL